MIQKSNSRNLAVLCGCAAALLLISDIDASAQNQKRSEAYFITRAERAAKVTCAREKTPKRTRACRNKQMAAANRVVRYIKRGNREKRLKRTLNCLQKVQVLPLRLRRRGMLWVESCSKR